MINMEIQKQNAAIDLRLTLIDAAQCFHWVETERGFGAVFEGSAVWLRAGEDVTDARLRRYLDLDRDYSAIAGEYADIPFAREAFAACPGLRVLDQPPWEALFSFILSANNNVVRIRSLVYAISRAFGPEVDGLTDPRPGSAGGGGRGSAARPRRRLPRPVPDRNGARRLRGLPAE